MVKLLGGFAAGALLFALALPGPASAAESKRADGVTNQQASQITEVSSRKRRYHRRHYVRRHYYPRYYYPYAYAPRRYYYPRPYYYPRYYYGGPTFSFGFRF